MLAYIRGILVFQQQGNLVIEAGGLGYRIHVPISALDSLPGLNQETSLHLSSIWKETGPSLFGFLTANERDLFDLLLTVSGIGPKTALALLGNFNPSQLRQAILSREHRGLLKVPGLGKKSVERLFVELSDKIALWIPPQEIISSTQRNNTAESLAVGDAIQALVHLGYSHAVAQRAIAMVLEEKPQLTDLPHLITAALIHASK